MTDITINPKGPSTLLLAEDDPALASQMQWALAPRTVLTAASRPEAMKQFRSAAGACSIAIIDLGLPPDRDGAGEGLALLSDLLAERPRTKVIVVSGNDNRANAVKAAALGAFDFISKPVDVDMLTLIIDRAERMQALEEENLALKEYTKFSNPGLICRSPQMVEVQRMIDRLGPRDVSVLIQGESGTGKEVVARLLHENSPRRAQKFIAINCASIPENLLESELFGHERGAFTGAFKQTPGKFELADNGTLFLDEVGDMPLLLQAKLLRFLQSRELERVGGRSTIRINVRVLSATNQPLERLVTEGRFREDLYYRLNEVCIRLPPLAQRDGDTTMLAYHFLNLSNRANGRNIRGFSSDALTAIAAHSWPGNVRELENRVKRAVVMADGAMITAADLDLPLGQPKRSLNLRAETEKLERMLLQEALTISRGNISQAAKLMGVSRPYVYNLKRQVENLQ
jgi:two-component system NtrC family response regulator